MLSSAMIIVSQVNFRFSLLLYKSSNSRLDWYLFHAASTRRANSTRHAWILCYKSTRVSRVFPFPHRFHAFFPPPALPTQVPRVFPSPPGYNTHTITFRTLYLKRFYNNNNNIFCSCSWQI